MRMERRNNRTKYIEIIFDKHDHNRNGTLESMEAKSFLADVFDLDYHNEMHRKTANKILHIVGTTERIDDHRNQTVYEKERFKDFFVLPNFIELCDLENLYSL